MPIIDERQDILVLRVVYDGPPFSGKTTTLRTLSEGLGVDIVTPQEQQGRTLAFDWVDYVGGLFDGRQIRCQIVSVPGQPELATRRRHLLESADAVVVVADTRRTEMGATFALLEELLSWSRTQQPPVGLVLQANKRDAPSAMPREELQSTLAKIAPLGLIETVATTGYGVREAFVFGVRLALDRVRALVDAGTLPRGRPLVDDPAQLLREVARIEAQAIQSAPPPPTPTTMPRPRTPIVAPPPTVARPPRRPAKLAAVAIEDEPLFKPDPTVPGGFIWPPVHGRALLDEAAQADLQPRRQGNGDWLALDRGWRLHSSREALYPDGDAGRNALIEWARMHAACVSQLSDGRVLILADAGDGRHRLWQLLRERPTLMERIGQAGVDALAPRLADELCDAATALLEARQRLDDEMRLPCTLSTIAFGVDTPAIFAGLVPLPSRTPTAAEPEGAALLGRELGPVLRGLFVDREDFVEVVGAITRTAELDATRPAVRMLARLALAHL